MTINKIIKFRYYIKYAIALSFIILISSFLLFHFTYGSSYGTYGLINLVNSISGFLYLLSISVISIGTIMLIIFVVLDRIFGNKNQ